MTTTHRSGLIRWDLLPQQIRFPELDAELLYDIIRWAAADARTDEALARKFATWGVWDQGHWGWAEDTGEGRKAVAEKARNGLCQTAYCVAGQAVSQAGYRLVLNEGHETLAGATAGSRVAALVADRCRQQVPTDRRDDKGLVVWEDAPGSHNEYISEVAPRILGLHAMEADWLFEGDNDITHLKELANGICEVRGLPWMFPAEGLAYGGYEDAADE